MNLFSRVTYVLLLRVNSYYISGMAASSKGLSNEQIDNLLRQYKNSDDELEGEIMYDSDDDEEYIAEEPSSDDNSFSETSDNDESKSI